MINFTFSFDYISKNCDMRLMIHGMVVLYLNGNLKLNLPLLLNLPMYFIFINFLIPVWFLDWQMVTLSLNWSDCMNVKLDFWILRTFHCLIQHMDFFILNVGDEYALGSKNSINCYELIHWIRLDLLTYFSSCLFHKTIL